MPAGQSTGTGAFTELEDEKVRKNDILSNREKAQRAPGRGLDGKGILADEYKDNPANRRRDDGSQAEAEDSGAAAKSSKNAEEFVDAPEKVDRPGFDLGGSTGTTRAGKGLGLGTDAKEGRKGWKLPR